jgi:hypothetical protein
LYQTFRTGGRRGKGRGEERRGEEGERRIVRKKF